MTSMRNWILGSLLALFALGPAAAQDSAAKVVMITGQATAVGGDGTVRVLAKDDGVFSGDVISSGPGSYLNLQFSDGGFFLLRPNTRFEIEDYRYTDLAKAAATPAAPAASPAPTPATAATLLAGPSQEEVTQACTPSKVCRECRASGKKGSASCNACYVRVQNCKSIKQAFAAAKARPSAPATQVAAPAATPAPAPAPAPATAAPVVTAGVAPGSDSSRAFFRLVKGGFRTVSGLIGKASQDDYRVNTPVATIGIRGTRYGVRICQGECADREEILTQLRAAGRSVGPGETVLVTTVEEGEIALQTALGTQSQTPGGARLIDGSGRVTIVKTAPRTEQQDQDIDPQACAPGG